MSIRNRTNNFAPILKGFLGGVLAVCMALLMMHIRTSSAQQNAAQAPVAGQAQGAANGAGQGRGRGGLPNATPEQTAAVTQMNASLAPQTQALAAARAAVIAASLAQPRDNAAIQARVADVKNAEVALANARADELAKIQASPNQLSADQLTALAAAGGRGGRGGGGGGRGAANAPVGPDVSADQARAIIAMNDSLTQLTQNLQMSRAAVTVASLTVPKDGAAIQSKADAVSAAELALAQARAAAFAKIEASPSKLDADQTAALAAVGGAVGGFGTRGTLSDFNDHKGYVSLFDGVSLKGWDGNPKFWRVEDGAIVGESTPTNPSGNTYIVYRGVQAHDFTLKMEIKIVGTGGSGIQYRSKTGIPWTSTISPEVLANTGPVNLNWMLTGPQADFWPTNGNDIYSGQFYVENDPMRIVAWRGEVVEGQGPGTHRVMGMIGDGAQLASLVKKNDWNQYTVIARGGTFIHIINGQLMSVFVDDDPKSTTQQNGYFGIEMEAVTKVFARNIWLKKIN
jgi:hypothetical protein